jgi:hypothetical protein
MKDQKPQLREGASDFERQLLSAAMRERPSPQLRSRMRRTLGLTGPIAWAGSVKAMLASVAGKSVVGVAVVGLAAAGVVGVRAQQAERAAVEAPSAAPAAPPSAAVPPSPVALPAAPPVEPATAEPTVTDSSNGELREEIQLLDEARTALQRGSSAAALEPLDRYRQRFPRGVLRREAALLRQQAAAAARSSGAASPAAPRSR